MTNLFAKIFAQILDSSIAEDWYTRHVFEDLLKLADRDGVVDMTFEALCRRWNVPADLVPIVRRALDALSKPDPASRTSTDDGRRIELIDPPRAWGWRIINFKKWRDVRSGDDLRAANRERQKRFRERHSKNAPESVTRKAKSSTSEALSSRVTPRDAARDADNANEKEKEKENPQDSPFSDVAIQRREGEPERDCADSPSATAAGDPLPADEKYTYADARKDMGLPPEPRAPMGKFRTPAEHEQRRQAQKRALAEAEKQKPS